MQSATPADMLDYAWKYFALHADQRIKTFNSFLVLCTLVTGGLIAVLKDADDPSFATPLALLLPFLSFVFWKLDQRSRQLVHHAEAALKRLESTCFDVSDDPDGPNVLKVFSREESVTATLKARRNWNPFTKFFSYSTCFRAVFLAFGIAGIILAGILGVPGKCLR